MLDFFNKKEEINVDVLDDLEYVIDRVQKLDLCLSAIYNQNFSKVFALLLQLNTQISYLLNTKLPKADKKQLKIMKTIVSDLLVLLKEIHYKGPSASFWKKLIINEVSSQTQIIKQAANKLKEKYFSLNHTAIQ